MVLFNSPFLNLLLGYITLGGIIGIYLLLHSPAIIMLIVGAVLRKKKPKTARILFILAGIYFVVGLGVCGFMF